MNKVEKIIIAFVLFMLAFGYSLAVANEIGRYESGWVRIPQNSVYGFQHELGTRPLEVDCWVAHFLKVQTNFTDAVPCFDWPGNGITIQSVNEVEVRIRNLSGDAVFVQVIANP